MADQHTDVEFTIDDVFEDASLPRQEVPMCLRGDLVAAWQSLERRFKQANEVDEDTLASATSAEARDLAQQMADLEEQMRASTRVFQLEGLPRRKWREHLKAHPPGEAEETVFNGETFPVAAVAACTVVPKMTIAQAEKLNDRLTNGQWDTLFAHIWAMNNSKVDVPFSLAASALVASSAPKPK
jgi:hypothetical protein